MTLCQNNLGLLNIIENDDSLGTSISILGKILHKCQSIRMFTATITTTKQQWKLNSSSALQ